MEYNTTRNEMSMREYGRHIQKMVEYLLTIEDKEERQQQAQVVIELMGFLNPHLKNVEDFRHKLWDHLFYISDFKLQVDSPYPIPQKETYRQKPDPLPYPKRYPKFSHLGKNLEVIINKALNEEDFAAAMRHMAALRVPVDAFFEGVKVNAEDAPIRENRLHLLAALRAVVHQIGDFSKIEGVSV